MHTYYNILSILYIIILCIYIYIYCSVPVVPATSALFRDLHAGLLRVCHFITSLLVLLVVYSY